MQDGKFSKIDKHAGWNKGMQVGLFLFSLVKIKVLSQKFLKLIKVQDGISMCRLDFFKKIIRVCYMIIRYCRVSKQIALVSKGLRQIR